ncbi:unnamed protein product [Mytilus coruscus]|uniref:SRCR domain-containing protein n=1 Tax=Mytilus coruscus TaxID=42192 RepID=A0A6J8DPN4_MYTCO|nr:unnamed protein product [Mytilus coruscus]
MFNHVNDSLSYFTTALKVYQPDPDDLPDLDRSVLTPSTLRSSFVTLKWQGKTLKSTIYPGSCRLNQTASYVVTPGVLVAMSDISDHELGYATSERPTYPLVTESTPANTTQDYGLDMITMSTGNVTIESKFLVILVQYEIFTNMKYRMYGISGWDDSDATVLCKSFNRTWFGQAIAVENLLNIPIFPYSFNCCGLEHGLFACNITEDENGCNTTKVAGAMCYLGSGKPGQRVTNSNNEFSAVESGSSFSGYAVGISAAFIVVVCIIIVVVIIRRRSVNSYHKEDKESLKRKGEEIQTQEISFNACTNVASRLSDHTYDQLESEELNCCSIDSNLQKETNVSFTRKEEKSRYQKTGFDECTNIASRFSDHTYDLLEFSEYSNITNVSVPSEK